MADRINIYVSCTNKDIDLKWVIQDGIIQAGMYPLTWETMPTTTNNPLDAIRKSIAESEIFIGIYALWYGGRPQESPKSWIEFEYDYAFEKNKHILIYLLSETQLPSWPDEMKSSGEDAEKLEALKLKIKKNHKVSFFRNREELFSLVSQHLRIPPYSEIGAKRIVVEPVFGLPLTGMQFDTDVFMIMPFSEGMTPIYEGCIKPLIENLGLTIKRADNLFSTQPIMGDIWSVSNAAKFIIADCTGKNPNVFYELGIAHTLGKPAIVLTQNPEDVPFDIRHLRYIHYQSTTEGLKKLENDLKDAIKKVLEPPKIAKTIEPRWKRPTTYISLNDEI